MIVGSGITVVDPGAKPKTLPKGRLRGSLNYPPAKRRLLRAYVAAYQPISNSIEGAFIVWKVGKREGVVYENDEGRTWFEGHGPQARAAFEVARALS